MLRSPTVGAAIAALVIATCMSSPLGAADPVLDPAPLTPQQDAPRAIDSPPSSSTMSGNPAFGAQQFANLGQLLNAGGKLMSPQQFKDEIVQRLLTGVLPSEALVEFMYTSGGMVAGSLVRGRDTAQSVPQNWPVSGSWTIDESERICTGMRINTAQGASIIPVRCQFWFKLGDTYYVCDSDEDRSAKLLARVPKR